MIDKKWSREKLSTLRDQGRRLNGLLGRQFQAGNCLREELWYTRIIE